MSMRCLRKLKNIETYKAKLFRILSEKTYSPNRPPVMVTLMDNYRATTVPHINFKQIIRTFDTGLFFHTTRK